MYGLKPDGQHALRLNAREVDMPARKPDAVVPTDHLMMIIGQLLEATKAASDGLKSMSVEVQSNAKAIIAAIATLEKIEEKVSELNEIIRDTTNAMNLVAVSQKHSAELSTLQTSTIELKKSIDALEDQVGQIDIDHEKDNSSSQTVWDVVKVVGWLATAGIAMYAAVNGK